MRTVLALARKDLLLHWRGVLTYTVGYAAGGWALIRLLPPLGSAGPPPIMLPIALYFALVCSGWLVERERSRETFALLRALPVSDLAIVSSKFVACFAMQLFGFVVALIASPLSRFVTPVQLVTVFALFSVFASLVLAVQLSFTTRRAVVAPVFLMLAAAIVGSRIAKAPDLVADVLRLWADPWAHAAMWAGCVLLTVVLTLTAWLRMRSQDTQSLIG